MNELVSIIVPTKDIDPYVRECLAGINLLDYGPKEVILLPDEDECLSGTWNFDLVLSPTGSVMPSSKRNIGVEKARGNIIAFIDSDARPFPEWLTNAVRHLAHEDVGAVGGPNLTPPEDGLLQKASGDILASSVAWGPSAIRNREEKRFTNGLTVKELPSCNLVVKKELIQGVGGFDTSILTAEDAKLCFKIREMGKRVVYSPDVKVYHHRRKLFLPHIRQMFVYGRDKIWVLKERFSFKDAYYLIPLGFLVFLLLGLIGAFMNEAVAVLYTAALALYFSITLVGSLAMNLRRSPLVFPGILLTHISYGIGSLCGFLTKRISK